ncbi:MAG: alpha/beta hydrolase [Dehalococcoidia bacterium]|nr:alpha/beta hydrolase [Dehalococcoidia bacterium]
MAVIREVTLATKDGKVHFSMGGLGREAVLLLHPMGSSCRAWSKVMDALADRYPVYALDMLGQGDSAKPRRVYSIEDYARSVLNFMQATALPRATIIGNSVGAMLAAQMAVLEPRKVRKLALVGVPAWTDEERSERRGLMDQNLNPDGSAKSATLEDLKASWVHPTPELLLQINSDRAKVGTWHQNAMAAILDCDIRAVLPQVRAPTLVVYGEKDMLRNHEQFVLQSIPGSRLALVPDAGHVPQMENPKGFLELVLPFLEKASAEAGA